LALAGCFRGGRSGVASVKVVYEAERAILG
jgi:hypothetical protein